MQDIIAYALELPVQRLCQIFAVTKRQRFKRSLCPGDSEAGLTWQTCSVNISVAWSMDLSCSVEHWVTNRLPQELSCCVLSLDHRFPRFGPGNQVLCRYCSAQITTLIKADLKFSRQSWIREQFKSHTSRWTRLKDLQRPQRGQGQGFRSSLKLLQPARLGQWAVPAHTVCMHTIGNALFSKKVPRTDFRLRSGLEQIIRVST